VLVGHSYGSLVSNNVIAKYPNLADAVVLTGFSFAPKPSYVSVFVAAATLRISSQHDPLRYGNLDTGYIGFADIAAQVNTFFKAPYELGTVEYADSISAPAAISEFLSQASLSLPLEFGKPVLVATGEFDLPFCGGECHSTYAEQQLNAVFPKSTLIDTFLHPGAGHGINFAENATGFYAGISGFLERAGF
jgi:pimeloyl-ACP methyl ester carboxylesterase